MPDWNPRANDIFVHAAEINSPTDRRRFVEQQCDGDTALQAQVESLMAAGGQVGSFLQRPAVARPVDVRTSAYNPLTEGPGTRVGPYKLLQEIGEGGMGTVFMAEQEEPIRRMVAVKIIRVGMDSKGVLARFEAERQALALMDHPNIAKVLDAGTTDGGSPYFVMELVKGMPITKFCDNHQLDLRERLELFVPVCHAIQHAHQKGVIHRDVKPSNVLVALYDDKPVPKVIDFGIAKATSQKLTDKTMFTAFGTVIGTLEYMSPEQAKLNQLDIDTRSDVYALGVLLYELLTGTTPLDRGRLKSAALDEVLRLIREEEPPRPSTRLSTAATLPQIAAARRAEPGRLDAVLRGELDWIVMRCLEKDRTRRYDGAATLAKDVQRFLAGDAVEACPPTLGYRLRKAYRKHRPAVLIAASFAVVLMVATAVSVRFGIQARRAEQHAMADRDRAVTAEQSLQVKHAQSLASEVKAKEEADAAGFMLDHFLTDGDKNVGNVQFSVLLDRAVRELNRDTSRSRLVKARIRGRIGRAYLLIGHEEDAKEQLEPSLQELLNELGPDNLETLESQQAFASAVGLRSKRGDDLLQKVLDRRRSVQGLDHPDVIRTLEDMGRRCFFQNKMPEAEKLFRQALELANKSQGADTKQTINCKLRLASHIARTGDYVESIRLTREAFESAKNPKYAADEPFFLRVERDEILYGSIRTGTPSDNKRRAEALLSLLPKFKKCFGDDDPITLILLDDISLSYVSGKLFKEAEPYSREYLEKRIRVHGEQADSVQRARWIRGETLLGLDRIAEAKAVLTESLEMIKKNDYRTVFDQATLGQCYLKEKNYQEAETNLIAGYQIARAYFPGEKMSIDRRRKIGEILLDLIAVATALNKPDDVQKWQKELHALPR